MNREETTYQAIRRGCYIGRFRIKLYHRHVLRLLKPSFMDKLDACKDDCARRLLLGISR